MILAAAVMLMLVSLLFGAVSGQLAQDRDWRGMYLALFIGVSVAGFALALAYHAGGAP